MSLVATASTWTNEESTNKKRIPSIRKTVKIRPQDHTNAVSNTHLTLPTTPYV